MSRYSCKLWYGAIVWYVRLAIQSRRCLRSIRSTGISVSPYANYERNSGLGKWGKRERLGYDRSDGRVRVLANTVADFRLGYFALLVRENSRKIERRKGKRMLVFVTLDPSLFAAHNPEKRVLSAGTDAVRLASLHREKIRIHLSTNITLAIRSNKILSAHPPSKSQGCSVDWISRTPCCDHYRLELVPQCWQLLGIIARAASIELGGLR